MINCGSERSPGLFIRKKSSATNLGSVKTKREWEYNYKKKKDQI